MTAAAIRRRKMLALLAPGFMGACAAQSLPVTSGVHLRSEDVRLPARTIPPPVRHTIALPPPSDAETVETYSIVVNNVRVQDLLFALARDARLNIDVHPGIQGTVRQVPLFIYGYQDKYRRIPGDDVAAVANVSAPAGHAGNGDGIIGGNWNDKASGSEAVLFWEHVRLANLAAGSTDFASATDNTPNLPTNAEGGRIGIQSRPPIAGMKGVHFVCSTGITGKLARQLDLSLDDGDALRGSMMAVKAATSTANSTAATPSPPVAEPYDETLAYTVCMSA